MPSATKPDDELPEDFGSEEAAAEFWDTHSIVDYEELLEPANLHVEIKRRHFTIEVDEECFEAVRDSARKQRKPVKQVASEIIKQWLGIM
jgi:hypothetical protein